jgi:hypothetical protein
MDALFLWAQTHPGKNFSSKILSRPSQEGNNSCLYPAASLYIQRGNQGQIQFMKLSAGEIPS